MNPFLKVDVEIILTVKYLTAPLCNSQVLLFYSNKPELDWAEAMESGYVKASMSGKTELKMLPALTYHDCRIVSGF
jgi:hypothetical protein